MELVINFKDEKAVKLDLLKEGKVLDTLEIALDHRFDTLLIRGIDKILGRNKINLASLKVSRVAGKEVVHSTAYKIARAVVEALKPL